MPTFDIINEVSIRRSPRVASLLGLFELPKSEISQHRITGKLEIEDSDWHVGLIVGPSGSGKTSIVRKLFPDQIVGRYDWPADRSIVDGFPARMSIKDITKALGVVGFSSPPAWLRPFHVLSNGEQFRVTLARAICEAHDRFVIDEFTSVVDRTVAKIGSAAIAKAVRKNGKQMIACSCHYDIIEWLAPDWVFEPHVGAFRRRRLRRHPDVELIIRRVHRDAWRIFRSHHYLDTSLHRAARCWCAFWEGKPVAFTSVLPLIGRKGVWRMHRTVCLPDYQGVGIGNALNEFVASVVTALGYKLTSVTGHPAMIYYRSKSPKWKLIRAPSLAGIPPPWAKEHATAACTRLTATFHHVGPKADPELARRMWAGA